MDDVNTPVLPLTSVKVLELSQILAGPTCGQMLGDLGADVIKIEKFPAGDDARGYRRDGDSGLAPSFLMVNRGKRSLALDIRTPRGNALVRRLVRGADVVTENFRLGTLERLGLGYEQLAAENPALVYCSITGYGRTGPLAHQGGFDLILQAFSGLLSVTGEPGGRPVKPGNSVADINAGLLAAFGVLAGYVQRLKTGRGTRVDTSLLHASMQQMYWFAAAYFSQGTIAKPAGTAHPLTAPYETFDCADGALAIGGANPANWERIAQLLGHPEWIADPRFATSPARLANRAALAEVMTAELRRHTTAHWLAKFDEAGVPAGPVHDVAQAMEHPQSRAAGMVIDVAHPKGGHTRGLGSPVQIGGRAFANTGPAPRLGQHSASVLHEFGLTDDEVRSLIDDGTVFQAPAPSGESR
ncbi:CaiB/BaiF CoA transferase family protein [Piscinibacter gummiphilus]|uniref:CoA-transferase n=1 Tax=Piscinibacter gummiphilus TaxID=946333 RepID=A0A1W6L8H1_9BURK|nr:CoA transferase [Piscinibacter gummiphilus]ARN20526.1 CoA-transferase [Piscinibacter gummiphilus]ATU65203.1 CoA transferase [Piscinibacter gummiphilus]GLS98397.1 CoA transferase [Piscinibacter gummiphilus]